MQSDVTGVIAVAFTLGGALITFGIMYGSLRKENDNFKESFKEFKEEVRYNVKELREEVGQLKEDIQGIARRGNVRTSYRDRNERAD